MVDKFIYSMQVFSLGFSVVMMVLFLLYLLIDLANQLRNYLLGKNRTKKPLSAETDNLSPQLTAAIFAAVNQYRMDSSAQEEPVRFQISLEKVKSSRWAAAGRSVLLENSITLKRLRGK